MPWNSHYTLRLFLFRYEECKLVIYSMNKYTSITFNKNDIVKLHMKIIDNYLDYCKIEIILSPAFK